MNVWKNGRKNKNVAENYLPKSKLFVYLVTFLKNELLYVVVLKTIGKDGQLIVAHFVNKID